MAFRSVDLRLQRKDKLERTVGLGRSTNAMFLHLLCDYIWRRKFYQENWDRIRTCGEGRGEFSDTMSGLDDMPIYGRGTYGVCI